MMNNIDILDSWQREDKCVAPLTHSQLELISKLENVCRRESSHVSSEAPQSCQTIANFKRVYDFELWFEAIEKSLSVNSDSRYKRLIEYNNECKQLIANVTQTLRHLDTLEEQYVSVSNKTKALYNCCEQLLQQQHALIVAVDTIDEKLTYFKEMQPISKV